jgi:hypothetical protein
MPPQRHVSRRPGWEAMPPQKRPLIYHRAHCSRQVPYTCRPRRRKVAHCAPPQAHFPAAQFLGSDEKCDALAQLSAARIHGH